MRDEVRAAENKRDTLREQFGWAGQHIAIYAGTVPLGHDMDMAVRAVQQVREQVSGKLRWKVYPKSVPEIVPTSVRISPNGSCAP